MSVWDAIVGQRQVVEQLKSVAAGDPASIAQSWLICGPPGSGRSNVARAFAAALESPDHGLDDVPTRTTEQILAGTHPDVTVLATNKVTIGIDEVRGLIANPSRCPARRRGGSSSSRMWTACWNGPRTCCSRRSRNPASIRSGCCARPAPRTLLPTIRSRTRIVNLAVPSTPAVAEFLQRHDGVDQHLAARAARLAEGHIGVARLYATNERVMTDRGRAGRGRVESQPRLGCRAVGRPADRECAGAGAGGREQAGAAAEADFRRVNGLGEKDRIPPALRGAYNAIAKKDELKRRATRRSRDVLDRALNSVASIYRDVAVLQNNAEDAVGLINLENRASITELSVRLSRADAVRRLEDIATARRRLNGNGNPTLVFEALFCALMP